MFKLSLRFEPPTYGDIRLYKRRQGKKPSNIIFLKPHATEHSTVEVYERRLLPMLDSQGIQHSSYAFPSPREQVVRLRKQLKKERNSDIDCFEGRGVLNAVLSLIDTYKRLSFWAEKIRNSDSSTLFVELHSYPIKNSLDYFQDPHNWLRLGRTNILVAKNIYRYLGNYWKSVIEGIEENTKLAEYITSILGFDLNAIIEQTQDDFATLGEMQNRMSLVEFPGYMVCPGKEDPDFHTYFLDDGTRKFSTSDFEWQYCLIKLLPTREPRDIEINKLFSTLIIQ
ncbi:MAG: hypothetical protein D6769_01815 [Methanobacteriota archaeon]|nr:MAG: hypothetical protein D6769_01815 [Euryarchaeota archaeon]